MNKLPVGQTIYDAYRFVFTHLGAIIGLIWVPMILVTVMGFFAEQRYYAAAAEAFASNNYATLGPSLLGLFCYFVAKLLLYAAMFVPVTQLALGQIKGGTLVHFSFGATEWRLFRALAGLVAFLIVLALFVGLLASLVLTVPGLARMLPPQAAGRVFGPLVLGAYFAIACVALRFVFLLPALAVNGTGPMLPGSWKLSEGNFGRLLLVCAATIGPVILLGGLAQMVLIGQQTLPQISSSTAMLAAQLHSMSANMPLTKGVDFLIAPVLIGLTASAGAMAYRILSAQPEPRAQD